MRLLDPQLFELSQTVLDKCAPDPALLERRMHRQMLQVAPPAIVPAQNAADNPPLVYCDEAQSRVPSQIAGCRLVGVGCSEDYTGCVFQ